MTLLKIKKERTMIIPEKVHEIIDQSTLTLEQIEEYEGLAIPIYLLIPKWITKRYLDWRVKRKYRRYLREVYEIKKDLTLFLDRKDKIKDGIYKV